MAIPRGDSARAGVASRWPRRRAWRFSSQQEEGTPDIANVPGTEEARRLDPVVVTATMVATPLEQLGATVTVVTGDEITQYNYDRIEDVFRQVPGVQVQTTGSPGKATSLSIRGGGSQRSLVLIDGLRTASPTLGATDIAEITIDAIERIEIVRGPQSTLYGADAITGVVNIITKKGAGPAQRQRVGGGRQLHDLPRTGERAGRLRRLQLQRHGEPVQHRRQPPPRRQRAERRVGAGRATTFPGRGSCR